MKVLKSRNLFLNLSTALFYQDYSYLLKICSGDMHIRKFCNNPTGVGGFFHSKGTCGCAARKGTHFRTSSLAKVYFSAVLVEFSLGQGKLFGNFGQRNVKIR